MLLLRAVGAGRSVTTAIALIVISLLVGSSLIISAQSGAIRYVYDAAGRLVGVIQPSGESAVYKYDAVGNLLSIERLPASGVAIIYFSPSAAPIGATVVITGKGFSGTPVDNVVTFNGVSAPVASSTANEIVTTVPVGATTGAIAVTVPAGSATSSTPFIVVLESQAPTVTALSPAVGVVGTAITITGTKFDPVAAGNVARFPHERLALVSTATTTNLVSSIPLNGTSGKISVSTVFGTGVSSVDLFVAPAPHTAADVMVARRMTIGGSALAALTAPEKIGLLIFEGVAGQRTSAIVQDATGSFGCFGAAVIAPGNTTGGQAFSCSGEAFLDSIGLATTGTYTLVIDPAGAGTGIAAAILYDVADITTEITPNSGTISVPLTTPGQNARLPFAGIAGRRMSVAAGLTSGSFGCTWSLVSCGRQVSTRIRCTSRG